MNTNVAAGCGAEKQTQKELMGKGILYYRYCLLWWQTLSSEKSQSNLLEQEEAGSN